MNRISSMLWHDTCLFFVLMLHCAFLPQQTKQNHPNNADSLQINSMETHKSYEILAQLKYNNQVKYIFNRDTTHVLCISTQMPKANIPKTLVPLRFFVYDLNSHEVIFEDALENGRVDWESNNQIKVSIIPETVKSNQPTATGYTYHVLSRKKQSVQVK